MNDVPVPLDCSPVLTAGNPGGVLVAVADKGGFYIMHISVSGLSECVISQSRSSMTHFCD